MIVNDPTVTQQPRIWRACERCNDEYLKSPFLGAICPQCQREADAMQAVEIFRDDELVVLPSGIGGCKPGWGVLVEGTRHGGRHYDYLEVLAHARACRSWTPEQLAEWTDRHAERRARDAACAMEVHP